MRTKLTGTRQERLYSLKEQVNLRAKEARCWIPTRCDVSNKRLFLKKAIKLTREITGPGDSIYLEFWLDPKEYLLIQIGS